MDTDLKNASSSGTSPEPKERDPSPDHIHHPQQEHGTRFSRIKNRRTFTQSRHGQPTVLSWKKPPPPPLIDPDAPRLPKRGRRVKCALKDVMSKLKPLKLDGENNRARPELIRLDSLANYGVSDADAFELHQIEAKRFLEIIEDPQQPVTTTFDLTGSPYLQGTCTGEDCYRRLSSMSQSISTAINICLLDNECINTLWCRPVASRERLAKYVLRARVAQRDESVDNMHEDYDRLESIIDLIDYVTAILARLISQTADGDFWLLNTLAALVARTAKIKFLMVDIVGNAVKAANDGQEVLDQAASRGLFGDNSGALDFEEDECEEALRIINANQKDGLASEQEVSVASFLVNQNKYRSGLNTAIRYALDSLRLMNLSGLPPTTYEMCLLVYEIGFEGFKTALFQDRDLEYSASSDRDVLNTTQSALIILDQILKRLQRTKTPREITEHDKTVVEWAYHELDDSDIGTVKPSQLVPRALPLDSMADIITVIIPLAFTSPILLAAFTKFRTMMALTGDVKDVVRSFQEGQFGTYCRLYTREFDQEAENREILRLSHAFKCRTFSRCRLLDNEEEVPSSALTMIEQDAREADLDKELMKYSAKMNGWLIDENSVTVSCRRYVSIVMLTALLLASGGLTIGFTVGERIQGVDPFNLATYAWVLAAFIILICKSVLVENWSWSDFLQFRVRCKSVSELAATTQMDEQAIIAKLLHDDGGDGILVTRGPFNSVFRRQANSENGFSINVKIKPKTLIRSGLAPLKVVTPRGHAIVCLDHRRGTFLAVVEHEGVKESEHLVCDDIDRHIKDWKASKPRRMWPTANHVEPCKLHLTKTNEFKWKRVQGLCDLKEGEVVFV